MKLERSTEPCRVCGWRASWVHEGHRYCSRHGCQLVACGMWTLEQARTDIESRKCATPVVEVAREYRDEIIAAAEPLDPAAHGGMEE